MAHLKKLLVSLCPDNFIGCEGGTVAEWSKALLLREKINENQKISVSLSDLDNVLFYI